MNFLLIVSWVYFISVSLTFFRRNGAGGVSSQSIRPSEDGSHHLQEYTYKKITACDVCSQILRGHTRQGLRCRICKLNAHGDCAGQLPRCQPKQKLLRRQKSTSELENRIEAEEEIDEDTTKEIFNDVETANDSNQSPRKFRQKTPFIDRITKLGIDILNYCKILAKKQIIKKQFYRIVRIVRFLFILIYIYIYINK
uniref:Phorbol-ester/DAG-type domain-containing protein n=1 Tax=Glossina palpalis gambiensis TaxID=67801 RepID=A0A1B0AZP4_9MUSC